MTCSFCVGGCFGCFSFSFPLPPSFTESGGVSCLRQRQAVCSPPLYHTEIQVFSLYLTAFLLRCSANRAK